MNFPNGVLIWYPQRKRKGSVSSKSVQKIWDSKLLIICPVLSKLYNPGSSFCTFYIEYSVPGSLSLLFPQICFCTVVNTPFGEAHKRLCEYWFGLSLVYCFVFRFWIVLNNFVLDRYVLGSDLWLPRYLYAIRRFSSAVWVCIILNL